MALVVGLALLTVAVVTAWLMGVGETALSPRPVRGILVDVQATSIMFAERITLRTDDGELLEFQVSPEVATNREEPQSASHLRQHMILGETLMIRYRLTADGPLAVRVHDVE